MQADLHARALSGISWLTLGQFTKHMLQFQLGIVLARLLTPREFGLIGLVMVFIGFAGLFNELGFGAALIQREKVDERHWSSVFWINLAAGVVLTLLFLFAAPSISRFYSESILTPITMVIAFSFIIGSMSMVPIAMLTRDMNFRTLTLIETTASVLGGLLAVVLALTGFGVWSLVWRAIAVAVVTAIGMWWITRWRPQFIFDARAVRELLAFSSNLLGYRAINYWVQNGNDLVIGRFLGTAALGIYSRAYMMLLLPLNEVVRVFGRVMFPILSRMQDDPARVRRSYLRSVSMIALLLFPVMLGLSAVSSDFVLTLYGQVWADVIPILAILSLVAVPQSLIATGGWIFQSQGRADWIFRWGIVSAVATLFSVGVGLWIGSLLAVVASYAIMSGVILVYPAIAIPGRLIDMRFSDVVRAVAGPLSCSVVMAASVWALTIVMPDTWMSWSRLAMSVTVGAVLYLGLVHVTRVQAYNEARAIALSMLRGLRESRSTQDVSNSSIAPVPAQGKE